MTEIPLIPTTTHLEQDVPCIGCGYNLRGLDPSGRCSECGLAVANSIRGDRLEFADPAWLNKLRFGASLKLWNILITILSSLLMGFITGFLGVPIQFALAIGAIGATLGLWATFCITTQEPRTALTEDPVTLRKILRTCALVAFVGSMFQQFFNIATTPGTLTGFDIIWVVVGLASTVAGLIVLVGELKYFRRFALRGADFKLARSTRIMMWGLAIAMGITSSAATLTAIIFAPLGGVTTTVGPSGIKTTVKAGSVGSALQGTGFPILFAAGMCVIGVATLAFFIWYLIILGSVSK